MFDDHLNSELLTEKVVKNTVTSVLCLEPEYKMIK
jgi:hypothetical protein